MQEVKEKTTLKGEWNNNLLIEIKLQLKLGTQITLLSVTSLVKWRLPTWVIDAVLPYGKKSSAVKDFRSWSNSLWQVIWLVAHESKIHV